MSQTKSQPAKPRKTRARRSKSARTAGKARWEGATAEDRSEFAFKGGQASSEKMTEEQRSNRANAAASKRWVITEEVLEGAGWKRWSGGFTLRISKERELYFTSASGEFSVEEDDDEGRSRFFTFYPRTLKDIRNAIRLFTPPE